MAAQGLALWRRRIGLILNLDILRTLDVVVILRLVIDVPLLLKSKSRGQVNILVQSVVLIHVTNAQFKLLKLQFIVQVPLPFCRDRL